MDARFDRAALVVIDMQVDMQHRLDAGRDSVNPDARNHIARLLERFREKGLLVIHVRHAEGDPASPFHPESSGYAPIPGLDAAEGEPIFVKTSSSAFASTDLEGYLRTRGIQRMIVTGAVAGFCVMSTTRAGSDLGFAMAVVRDAVLGFDLPHDGLSARQIFNVTMGLLGADFAEIVDTETVLTLVHEACERH